MFANALDQTLIASVLSRARLSPRLRANHCFHNPTDRLQRMINAAMQGTYFAPHRHEDPDKLEIFTILSGSVMAITFTDAGEILDQALLTRDEPGFSWQVEIPPRAWHTLVVLSSEAVLYEVIDGYFDAKTHKQFPTWAPAESELAAAQDYLADLRKRIDYSGKT